MHVGRDTSYNGLRKCKCSSVKVRLFNINLLRLFIIIKFLTILSSIY